MYFDATNSRDWVNVLPEIVDKYNNTKHSTIKMTPVEASKPESEVPVFESITRRPKQKKTKKVHSLLKLAMKLESVKLNALSRRDIKQIFLTRYSQSQKYCQLSQSPIN